MSGCSAAKALFYTPGLAVEMLGKCVYDPTIGRGGEWRAATVVAVAEGESVTIKLDTVRQGTTPRITTPSNLPWDDTPTTTKDSPPELDPTHTRCFPVQTKLTFFSIARRPQEHDDPAPVPETFTLGALAKRVRPCPPSVSLPVEGRTLGEEVDVFLNKVWTEGVVVKCASTGDDADRQKITVALPAGHGTGAGTNRDVVVFSDSQGQVWARDMFQKRGAKVSGIRRGWAFTGTAGAWLVRGAALSSAVTSEQRGVPRGADGGGTSLSDLTASVFKNGQFVRTQPLSHGPRVGHATIARLEAGSACASPRRSVRGDERVGPGDFSAGVEFGGSNRVGAGANTGSPIYGHGESVHAPGFGTYDPTGSPPFKSLSDACRHLLLDAGRDGLQVSEMVRVIQRKNLVKLGGRTPSNTVYSRLSQDVRFVNVSRGAYALAEVCASGATTNSPPRFDGGRSGALGGAQSRGDHDGDTGSVHGDFSDLYCAEGGDEIFKRTQGVCDAVAAKDRDNGLKDSGNNDTQHRRVSGRLRQVPAVTLIGTAKKTEAPASHAMADSSAFSVDVRFAPPSTRGGDDEGDVELSAELSAGVLMGLRSGR